MAKPLMPEIFEFLSGLVSNGGSATSQQLGGYTPKGNRARQQCSLRGFAMYSGSASHNGIWSITDAGRAALCARAQEEMERCPYWNGEKSLSDPHT